MASNNECMKTYVGDTIKFAYYRNRSNQPFNICYNSVPNHNHDMIVSSEVVRKQLFLIIPHTQLTSWGVLQHGQCIRVNG
ncbi:Hypothetical predicted protein, partial [Paramuricea clavata]